MLARRCVYWTDGVFGFVIARGTKLVIYSRLGSGVDTTDSIAVGPAMVTCSCDTSAAEARWSRKSPGELSRGPFWRQQQVKAPV